MAASPAGCANASCARPYTRRKSSTFRASSCRRLSKVRWDHRRGRSAGRAFRSLRAISPTRTCCSRRLKMLKGLDPLLSPELLSTLRAMGHGDEIAIVDGNYPGVEHARRLIRLDG